MWRRSAAADCTHRRTRLLSCIAVVFVAGVIQSTAEPARRARRSRPEQGYLELISATTGAEVYVDGVLVGTVPLESRLLFAPGKHTLKLIKQGYTQYLDVFSIVAGAPTRLEIDLLPIAAVLQIRANLDEARVFVDGKFVGTAPLETEVLPGPRSIVVRRAGYHDFITELRATAGQVRPVVAELAPLPVGTSPYRPAPVAQRWYERWYLWAGAAGAVAAVAVAVIVPVVLTRGDPVEDFAADFRFSTR